MGRSVLLCFLCGCLAGTGAVKKGGPEKLKLQARPFSIPRGEDHRVLLNGAVPAYLGQDKAAPVLRVTLLYRTGIWLDPPGKEGLAEAAAFLLRSGGAGDMTPEQFDKALEDRAIELRAEATQDTFRLVLWSLAREGGSALDLLRQAVTAPRFDSQRLELWKKRKIEELKALHDGPEQVVRLYWRDIIWGENHTVGRRPTLKSVQSITREDLIAWRKRFLVPENLFLVATSDRPVGQLRKRLEAALEPLLRGSARKGGRKADPFASLPQPPPPKPPGVYLVPVPVHKATLRIGHRGIRYSDKRLLAFQVVSYIFGEGSFQSRLTERVRTEEGLTYGIFSYVIPGWVFPGTTIVQASTDPPNVSRVIELVREEVQLLAEKGVTLQEIDAAKKSMIARFAGFFEDLHDTLTATALLEYRGRPLDFYATYRKRLGALTPEEINRAARAFLKPGELKILIAGDLKAIEGAKPPLSRFGPVRVLPLRDPLK